MKQAIVLAAGEGRRLRPFTRNKSKAMLSLGGWPVIHYVFEALTQTGFREIVCVVGYAREEIIKFIGDGSRYGAKVTFAVQERQLGTAHALQQAEKFAEEEFLVLHGNKVIDKKALEGVMDNTPFAIMAGRSNNPSRYGVLTVENGFLKKIEEKPSAPKSNLINRGIYILNRRFFEYIDDKLDIPNVLMAMLEDRQKIKVIEGGGRWLDIVYPWDLLALNNAVLQDLKGEIGGLLEDGVYLRGSVKIGKNTVIKSGTCITGPVVIGDGCEIGPQACILPATSIGNNVVVGPFTEIRNSILEDDVFIGTGAIIQDSVIDKGTVAGPHFCAWTEEAEVTINEEHHRIRVGTMCGEGCRFASGVTVSAGTVVGNYVRVSALKLISGVLPDNSLVV